MLCDGGCLCGEGFQKVRVTANIRAAMCSMEGSGMMRARLIQKVAELTEQCAVVVLRGHDAYATPVCHRVQA